MKDNLTDQAIRVLTERHWPLMPVRATKKPYLNSWKDLQQHLTSVDQILAWGRRFRPAAWAVIAGALADLVVMDFDGAVGCRRMQAWSLNPHIRTPSDESHVYLKHPGWRVPTLNAKAFKNRWPWPGVDIRGDGGYAVLLGRNLNGRYVQLRELQPEPFGLLPPEVREFLRRHGAADSSPAAPATSGSALPVGSRVRPDYLIDKALEMAVKAGRNNVGFWLAVQLRDNDYSEVEALSVMEHYRARVGLTNTKGAREVYSHAEMVASLRQAFSRPPRKPWI